jgi:hypothetical protein
MCKLNYLYKKCAVTFFRSVSWDGVWTAYSFMVSPWFLCFQRQSFPGLFNAELRV